jgi:hypothetical protein
MQAFALVEGPMPVSRGTLQIPPQHSVTKAFVNDAHLFDERSCWSLNTASSSAPPPASLHCLRDLRDRNLVDDVSAATTLSIRHGMTSISVLAGLDKDACKQRAQVRSMRLSAAAGATVSVAVTAAGMACRSDPYRQRPRRWRCSESWSSLWDPE